MTWTTDSPISQRLREIKVGFERPFWVANITEIFERLSYYGAFASLALYLQGRLNFSTEQTGTLTGLFGGMVWFLAIFGGAAADRLGFRRALSIAFLILAGSYFLIGSIGASGVGPGCGAVPLGGVVGVLLLFCGPGHRAGEAVRSRHDGAGVERECPVDWVFDLLHDGEHRRGGGALLRLVGAPASGSGKRVSRGGAERVRGVPSGGSVFSGAAKG